MTIYKCGDKWRAEPYVKGRRIGSQLFETKGAARDWHDEQRRQYRGEPKKKEVSFEELLEHFSNWHLPSIRPGTRDRYQVDIDKRIAPFFRYLALSKITPRHVEEFRATLGELAPGSANNCLHTLRLILNKAVRWKLIEESPYEVESFENPKGAYPWWDKEEHIQRFLDAARDSRYYVLYLMALETGLRYGELIGLSVGDVDLAQGIVHVHRQWLEMEGCYGPPKHGKERWVDFDPKGSLGEALVRCGRGRLVSEPLFLTANGALPTKGGVAHKYFKATIRRAKVPEICFHGLRHTFASWYMIRHDNVWDLKAILGHSDIKTTMRYAHHSKRARRKPLDLASITQKSRKTERLKQVTEGNQEGNLEWGYCDSNTETPVRHLQAIS